MHVTQSDRKKTKENPKFGNYVVKKRKYFVHINFHKKVEVEGKFS